MTNDRRDPAPTLDEFAAEMKRMIDAHYPGRGVDSFTGWSTEMRRAHGHHPVRLLRAAVSLYCDKIEGDGLPTPGEFRLSIEAAQRKAERDEIAGLLTSDYPDTEVLEHVVIKWTDPWWSTPVERQAWAKEDQWIRGWYRNILPHRDPPDLLWRVPPMERAAIIGCMLYDDQVGNRPKLRPGDRRRFYGSPDPAVQQFVSETELDLDLLAQQWDPPPLASARAAVLAIRPRPDGLDDHVRWLLRHHDDQT